MAVMEFLKANLINTTTMVIASTGTGTFGYLFDRNDSLAYATVGYTTNTSTLINIEFLGPTVISGVLLKNHNLRQFRAFYNSATANTFSIDVNVSSNSATSSYFAFSSVTVNSIQIQLDLAQTTDVERQIGELIVTERRVQFPDNPSYKDYDPSRNNTRIIHRMPDGGVTAFNIKQKFKASLNLEYASDSFTTVLSNIYEEALPLYFLPFPTTTAWDGRAYEILWTNDFNLAHAENSKTQGFSGKVVIEETPSA